MVNPKDIVNEFKKDLLSRTGRQTSTLYLSQIIALFLGVFTGIINTRVLGPEGYGILAFFSRHYLLHRPILSVWIIQCKRIINSTGKGIEGPQIILNLSLTNFLISDFSS